MLAPLIVSRIFSVCKTMINRFCKLHQGQKLPQAFWPAWGRMCGLINPALDFHLNLIIMIDERSCERSHARRELMASKTTLKQVAALAGVSYQTVSKVLNKQAQVSKETEQRIHEAVRELGYRPNQIARNMRAKRSFMIGYSWAQTSPNQVNHILDQFLTSMVREAEAAGYHLLPFPFREGDGLVDAYRELIDTGRVDGFVLSSVNYDDQRD